MSIKLPEPIENYLRNSEDGALDEAAAAFATEAIVFDKGEDLEIAGLEAIHRWMADYTSKYKTTLKVVGLVEESGEFVLTTLVSGNFDGSPAEFVYRFTLRDGLIEKLVIDFIGFK